jgi:hypothetical protein
MGEGLRRPTSWYNANMLPQDPWKEIFDSELQKAESARAYGNEGRARVCARRAAGIVIREYMAKQGLAPTGPSAYDLLRDLQRIQGLSPKLYEVSEHFLAHVTTDWQLPFQADLIDEARWLAVELLASKEKQ